MLVVLAVSDDQRFELYKLKIPQRHGQNLYKQNMDLFTRVGDIDGYDETTYTEDEKFEHEAVGSLTKIGTPVDESYNGQQYWYMYGEGGLFGGGLQDSQLVSTKRKGKLLS